MAGSNITGLDEVLQKLETMKLNARKKHVKNASKKALVPVRDDAKQKIKTMDDSKTKEKIWRNVQIQSSKSKKKDEIKHHVGVKGGAKAGNNGKKGPGLDTFYWRFLEFGTAKSPANPFLRPAFVQNEHKMIEIFTDEMKKSILEDVS